MGNTIRHRPGYLQPEVPRCRGARRRPWSNAWRSLDPAQPAAPTTTALPAIAATELLVIVREGDNRPLPITARILLPSYRVRVHRAQAAGLRLA